MWFMGIDVASGSLVCCLLDEQGRELESFSVPNSLQGIHASVVKMPDDRGHPV